MLVLLGFVTGILLGFALLVTWILPFFFSKALTRMRTRAEAFTVSHDGARPVQSVSAGQKSSP